MEITTCEQFVLATMQLYRERADKAEAEVKSLKKQLYDARDSKFAAEVRRRGRDSLLGYVTSYDFNVCRNNRVLDFDEWLDKTGKECWLNGLMTKDEFIEEFNQELSHEYEERVDEYEEKHGTD